ncbi:MAG: PAS domain S-box protein, partial [Alphaproteobacteria bacterium]|nr:PAS domain S-box protein [Alphaproteobacteria bacterium]
MTADPTLRSTAPEFAPWIDAGRGALLALALALPAIAALEASAGTATLWLVSGAAATMLLRRETKRWPIVLAGQVAGLMLANLIFGRAFGLSVALSTINAGEALLAAFLLRRFAPEFWAFSGGRDYSAFLVLGAALPALASGLAAGAWFGAVTGLGYWTSQGYWWVAHASGLVLSIPIALSYRRERFSRLMMGEGAAVGVATLVLMAAAAPLFGQLPVFLIFPWFIWAAIRGGFPYVALTGVLAALVGLIAMLTGFLGQWSVPGETPGARHLHLLATLFGMMIPCAYLGLLYQRLARVTAELGQSKALFDLIAERSPAVFYRTELSPVGGPEFLYVSPNLNRLAGVSAETYMADPGLAARMLHPEDRARVLDKVMAERTAPEFRDEYRVMVNGQVVWVRNEATRRVEPDGRVTATGLWIDITEAKQREAELDAARTSLQRFNELFERLAAHNPALLYTATVDRDGNFSFDYVSPSAIHVFGQPAEMFLKRPEDRRQFVHVDDREHIVREFEKHLRDPLWESEFRIYRHGEIAWLRNVARRIALPDGTVRSYGIMLDITETKNRELELTRVQHELRRFNQLFENLAEYLPVTVYAGRASAAGTTIVDYVSPNLPAITDVPIETWKRDPASRLDQILPEDRAAFFAHMKESENTRDFLHEYRVMHKGQVRWRRNQARRVTGPDGVVTTYGVVLDITDAKQRESELEQARRTEAIGRLAAGVAHDFNNLLAVILGNIEWVAERSAKDTAEARALGAARRAVLRGR